MLRRVINRQVTVIKRLTSSQTTTHFGAQTVAKDEKQGKVNEVFTNVADTYDKMNDAMSLGVHRYHFGSFFHFRTFLKSMEGLVR